ncbi:hypothetical protein ElyMa_000248400 [Elysia marginata]|uniref:Uncharacterized protein n=1 Tax=Elysia marginata TaxID=1093978 RepID=A0AAV4F1L9_9GAST|nr:hypothetical protein ElyMa_000248400 [Elysia marginata]
MHDKELGQSQCVDVTLSPSCIAWQVCSTSFTVKSWPGMNSVKFVTGIWPAAGETDEMKGVITASHSQGFKSLFVVQKLPNNATVLDLMIYFVTLPDAVVTLPGLSQSIISTSAVRYPQLSLTPDGAERAYPVP